MTRALVLAALLFSWSALAEEPMAGDVGKVIDGDTFRLAVHTVVRLAGIDAPERGQDSGPAASGALVALTEGRIITCVSTGRDRYRRLVATCSTPETPDLGEAMVRSGHAVRYPQYDKPGRYIEAEAEARRERRGVWAGDFTMPWDWRKEHRR